MHTLIEPKVHVSPNEAYVSTHLHLHKPEEVHVYEELGGGGTRNHYQGAVITSINEAYACPQHCSQTY